ncbi:MAG: cupin domain-containing protein [Chromatiales bacterium]|jgi:uncharacterized cupin superfamily protein
MSDEILVEHNATPMKLEVMGVYDWPIWRKEASTFDWTYDQQETCYIVRGEFSVTPEGGQAQHFKRGDLITFPAGMKCVWQITKDVEKHYDFQ